SKERAIRKTRAGRARTRMTSSDAPPSIPLGHVADVHRHILLLRLPVARPRLAWRCLHASVKPGYERTALWTGALRVAVPRDTGRQLDGSPVATRVLSKRRNHNVPGGFRWFRAAPRGQSFSSCRSPSLR